MVTYYFSTIFTLLTGHTMAKVIICILSLVLAAVAEPPVGTYLPAQQTGVGFPSSSYGAPSSGFGGPSGAYNAPSSSYSAPSSSYGAPSSSYGAPSSSYGAPGGGLRNTFAPSAAKVSFNLGSGKSGPSSQYGVPSYSGGSSSFARPSSAYGAPSSFGTPSSSYGAPSGSYGAPSSSYGAPSGSYGAPGGGSYYSGDDQSEPANYAFSYDVLAPEYNVEFGHQESRQYDTAKGSYYVLLPDGRKQKVEYTADANGYRPVITYVEPQGGFGAGGYSRGPSSSYGPPKSNGGYQY